jgi:hypothetical protein
MADDDIAISFENSAIGRHSAERFRRYRSCVNPVVYFWKVPFAGMTGRRAGMTVILLASTTGVAGLLLGMTKTGFGMASRF